MNTIDMLRALADHLQRHQLDDDSVMTAGLSNSGDLDVQVYAGQDGDMRGLLGAWAASIQDPRITAEPVGDSFHLHVTGAVAGFPITVTCVASGNRADQIRATLGVPAVPMLPTGDTLLGALASQPAAVA